MKTTSSPGTLEFCLVGRVLRAHVTKNAIIMEYDDKRTVAIHADNLNVAFGFHGTRHDALVGPDPGDENDAKEPSSADR